MATDRPTPETADSERNALGASSVDELLAHAGWVRALALALAGDRHVADDVVQETWVAALRRPPASGSLRPWLRTVVVNALRKRGRGESRRAERERRVEVGSESESPDELAERVELSASLTREVLTLPEAYRDAILRRYWRGLSAAEIARQGDLPPATVRARLARGLVLLRDRMERHFGSEEESRSALLGLAGVPIASIGAPGPSAASALEGLWIVKQSTKLAWGLGAAALVVGTLGVWRLTVPQASRPTAPAVAAASLQSAPAVETAGVETIEGERRAAATRPVPTVAPAEVVARATPDVGWRLRVVDGDRRALSDARVWRLREPETVHAGDVDGEVSAALDAAVDGGRWSEGTLVIARSGFASRFLYVTLGEGWTDLGEVVLDAGCTVVGRVVDEAGLPIAGARVCATGVQLTSRAGMGLVSPERARRVGPYEGAGVPATVTDEFGEFLLEGVALGEARVWASAADYLHAFSEPLRCSVGSGVDPLELRLAALVPEDTIEGIVLDPQGQPLPQAWLRYRFPSTTSAVRVSGVEADGRFRIVVEDNEPHEIAAADPEQRWSFAVQKDVLPGARGVVLQFTEARWMDVFTVDTDGAPVVADLAAYGTSQLAYDFEPGEAGAEPGHWRLRAPVESFQVEIDATGFLTTVEGPFDPGRLPAAITVVLERAAGVHGRVTAGGEPLAGATVELRESFRGSNTEVVRFGFLLECEPYSGVSVTTDDEGYFTVVPPSSERNEEYYLFAQADGYARGVLGPTRFDPLERRSGFEVDLGPGGTIAGQVYVPAGEEAGGRLVAASRGDGDVRVQRTDTDGSFRFEALTPGGWQVAYRTREAPESTRYSSRDQADPIAWDCRVYAGEVTRHDIDLRARSQARVAGRLAADGQPVAGWSVSISHRLAFNVQEPVRPVLTDADGRFELAAPPGPYIVSCAPPDDFTSGLTLGGEVELIEGEAAQWDLAWEWGWLIPAGTPAASDFSPRLLISWHGPPDRSMRVDVTRDASGRFPRTRVPAGRLNVHELRMERHTDADGSTREFERWVKAGELLVAAGDTVACEPN